MQHNGIKNSRPHAASQVLSGFTAQAYGIVGMFWTDIYL